MSRSADLAGLIADKSTAIVGEGGDATTNLQQGLCKHWILMNGTGTIAVTDSFNNSSITDDATGRYTITIANDMSNTTYSVTTSGADDEDDASGNARQGPSAANKAAGSFNVNCGSNDTTLDDWESVMTHIMGDLA